jgi:hypothetical protein
MGLHAFLMIPTLGTARWRGSKTAARVGICSSHKKYMSTHRRSNIERVLSDKMHFLYKWGWPWPTRHICNKMHLSDSTLLPFERRHMHTANVNFNLPVRTYILMLVKHHFNTCRAATSVNLDACKISRKCLACS